MENKFLHFESFIPDVFIVRRSQVILRLGRKFIGLTIKLNLGRQRQGHWVIYRTPSVTKSLIFLRAL